MLTTHFASERSGIPPQSPSSLPLKEPRHRPLVGKRAVIVEDEGITQLQLKKILRSEGVDVVGVAADGKDAVDVVLQAIPDFVLMDIRMPIMDGLEASERILARARVCIVMLTAFSEEEYQQRAQAIGTCGYVLKPVTAETLVPEIEAAVAKFGASAS